VTTVYSYRLAENALLPIVNEEKKVALVPHHHGIRLTEGLEANCQNFHALAMHERESLLLSPVALQLEKNPRHTLRKRRLVPHQICKSWWLV